MTTLQPFQLGNLHMAKGLGNTPLAVDVSLPSSDFLNGAHYRMPWAVSRDLQTAAMSGKELYFRVTDPLLKDVAHGGAVQTGLDFECSMFDGTAVPYVIKSYDGAGGTLMGVFKPFALAGSTAPTRGFLYFSNPGWTVSKEEPDLTFPNAVSVLFLPSGIDRSGAHLNLTGSVPAIPAGEPQLVNPGGKFNGSTTFLERDLTGDCGAYLFSALVQSLVNNGDNAPFVCGGKTSTATTIFHRHLFAAASGPTDSPAHTNAWRAGFANGTVDTYYETGDGIADTSLQHVVFRRVLGQSLELYVNGVLVPWAFKQEAAGALNARLNFTGFRLLIGRGATVNRWWDGYIDCFKFFKDDAKTAAWALAEYSNLMDIDGGVIFGSPETVTTSSVFGETIKIQADALSTADFKADKYSATVGGTIALRSPNPFDNPTNGRFTDQGANTVRYTNTVAADPDNDGAVHLTNGAGNVIIPVRAHIITVGPPPPSGFYKVPNSIASKMANAVVANGRTAFINAIASFKSNPNQYKTKALKLTGADITGGAITINTGGDLADPFVICMDGAGTDTGWSSRPSILSQIITTSPYTWFYGCQFDWPRVLTATYDNIQTQLRADWQFATACRFIGNGAIGNYAADAKIGNVHINFNRFDIAQTNAIVNQSPRDGYSVVLYFRITGSGTTAWVCKPLTIARNYWIDHATHQGASVDAFHIGEGKDDGGHYYPDINVEYNFVKAALKRGFYVKAGINMRRNDIGPLVSPGGSVYGSADCVIGFRGPFSRGGFCEYNRLRGGVQLMVHGPEHTILSNVLMDNSTVVRLTCLLAGGGKPTPSADGAQVFGNTGRILVPWFDASDVNTDDPTGKLGDYGGNIQLSGPNQIYLEDDTRTNIAFDSAGHPKPTAGSNGSRWRNAAQITKLASIPSKYNLEVPPFLDTTVCGPGAAGKVWGT